MGMMPTNGEICWRRVKNAKQDATGSAVHMGGLTLSRSMGILPRVTSSSADTDHYGRLKMVPDCSVFPLTDKAGDLNWRHE